MVRSPEGERAIVVGQIRRRLSVAAVRAQTLSLHGRLLVMGASAAEKRRVKIFLDMAATLARDRASYLETLRGHFRVRRGFGKVD